MERITPKEASKMSVKELRRLVGAANREMRARQKEFKSAGLESSEVGSMYIQPVRGQTKNELIVSLSDISKALNTYSMTLEGYKSIQDRRIETLRSRGFDFVDESNIRDFGRFMDAISEAHGKAKYDYGTAKNIFEALEKRGVDPNIIEDKFKNYLGTEKGLLDLEDVLMGKMPKELTSSGRYIRRKMGDLGLL